MLRRARASISPRIKIIGEDLLVYGIAAGVIWYESRGLSYHRALRDIENAKLGWLLPATLVSFLLWFLGENLLFARLFTHFHKRTGYLEMLPATAAAYFLQAVNVLLADGALMVFLHRRKAVPWFASGFTMAYFGFIDGIVFALLITAGGLLVPSSPVREYAPYSAAALVFFLLIAAWWIWREPRLRLEQWIYNRPSLMAFREATPGIYAELLSIRFLIIVPQGLLLWVCLASFHLKIPVVQVMVESPLILAAGASPITPAGLGPLQAVAVHVFARYAPEAKVMAAALTFGILQLLYRLPLGLGSAGMFVHIVLESAGHPEVIEGSEEEAPARTRRAHGSGSRV